MHTVAIISTIIASSLLGFLRLPWMVPASHYYASGLSAAAYSLPVQERAGTRQASKGVFASWSSAANVAIAIVVVAVPVDGAADASAADGSVSGRKADTAFSGMACRARPSP